MTATDPLTLFKDRTEIQEVMYRWCRAVDRRDWPGVRAVFHDDAYDNHGVYSGDIDGLIAWLTERHKTIERSMHFVSNMLIEFVDSDNALVETYALALQRYSAEGTETRKAIAGGSDYGDQPFDMFLAGRYVDRFQRRSGVWKILYRTVVFDNSLVLPVAPGGAKLGSSWPVSARDATDPLWLLRGQLGVLPGFGG